MYNSRLSLTPAERKFIKFIRTTGNLSIALRKVHDFGIHHTNIEIDEKMKPHLHYCIVLSEKIEGIERF